MSAAHIVLVRQLGRPPIPAPAVLRCHRRWHLSRPRCQQTRTFFGMGEILGVLANPAETIRQLNESRDLLRKAKEDLELRNEAKKIPKKHTFSKLPGFHGREIEQDLLRKILSGAPKMSVIFGATSVGKTALLREVLATDDFYVIKFDLRISGFADLRTLYVALCEEFERFFESMNDEEMNNQKLVFKHMVIELLEKEKEENGSYKITVADIASLMESLQSCLLKYWEYDPVAKAEGEESDEAKYSETPTGDVKARQVDTPESKIRKAGEASNDVATTTNSSSQNDAEVKSAEHEKRDDHEKEENEEKEEEEKEKKFKKKPVVFLMDEAHKLPALVDDPLSLKVFLDTLLVLTKQDRLCHVLLSTSDSFFQHFLRSMNVGHHAQILTIGDCSKEATQSFFNDQVVELVPDELKDKLRFEEVFEAFGGKLSHISDYMNAWVNAEGNLTPYTSAMFIQAYTLLQFHLTHSKFETFSPLSTATAGTSTDSDDARFSPQDLMRVMSKLVKPPYSLPYFNLCREIGTEQVDSMIQTRVLELRWTKSVTPEENWVERRWSEDGIERPIVLPMTRIIRRAMEVILREEEELKLELELEDGSSSLSGHRSNSNNNNNRTKQKSKHEDDNDNGKEGAYKPYDHGTPKDKNREREKEKDKRHK